MNLPNQPNDEKSRLDEGDLSPPEPPEGLLADTSELASADSTDESARVADNLSQPVTAASRRVVFDWRYVLRMAVSPLLFFLAGTCVVVVLAIVQQFGWLTSASSGGNHSHSNEASDVDYICPMMCTPPQKEPGRCPVCAMELVPAASGSSGGDGRSIVVDPATRRVANIRTVNARRVPFHRHIRTVGEITFDEGKLKTISAYTDGRFDKLYVDYTGAVVCQGDRLASFYSPELYSSQVEFLEATQSLASSGNSRSSIVRTNQRLQASARQRLLEFGMSEAQIEQLAREGVAKSRLDIVAPIHGTVIEKLIVEGQYVKEGQPLFQLADLSTVWLLLELFPDDAACVRYGQLVEARVKSLPGRTFKGRIAFIDPEVDPSSRTVSVRVVLDNSAGLLRIGDYAKATIRVPAGPAEGQPVYDPELANKWISPRHPHVISDRPGPCPLCGIEMKSAVELGFTNQPQPERASIVVPRSAVLSAAGESVVYVETKPGRFEIRRIITAATTGDYVEVVKGLAEGEKVAASGNFLLDSQMQLAGNPSLIDPTRAPPPTEIIDGFDATMMAEINQLPDEERQLAIQQKICPVTRYPLGSMGIPPKVVVNGESIFICCEGCRESLLEEPDEYLARLRDARVFTAESPTGDSLFPEIGDILSLEDEPAGQSLPEIGDIEMVIEDRESATSDSADQGGR